jgi:hypothetical protein
MLVAGNPRRCLDSFLGVESPWGSIKAGKTDTPKIIVAVAIDALMKLVGRDRGERTVIVGRGRDRTLTIRR